MSSSYSIKPYKSSHTTWPYTPTDFERMDPSPDPHFYSSPRFVTHIDDHAISSLTTYYDTVLPQKGRILDFCSSWISHYPRRIEDGVKAGQVVVIGMGMNREELEGSPLLVDGEERKMVWDLNVEPDFGKALGNGDEKFDAATCVVSIDYLTRPKEVLESLRRNMKDGGVVHLAISNRCFPTKVVKRWLRLEEDERLAMVGDYLHFSGWKNIEIVTVSEGTTQNDPLWVVRGINQE